MGGRRRGRVPAGNHRDAVGSALVEALVATLMLAFLGAYAYGFVRAALATVRTQEVVAEGAAATALAAAVWAQEMRVAGFGATGRGPGALRVATATTIEVAADLNGDGDIDDPHEIVAYGYDASRRLVTRATGGGAPQPFVTDVTSDGVRFSYFDAAGGELAIPAEGLSLAARRRVRAVRFELRLALAHRGAFGGGEVAAWTSSTVHLRNP